MSHSVLLVEDDRAIATVVSEALGEEGYRVTACTSIARRDALLAEAEFDVMLTDIVLEDGDGLDDIAALRSKAPAMPVIVLSAQNTLDTAVRASDSEAFEYFPKPFDLDALLRAVAQAVARNEAGAASTGPSDEGLPFIGRSQAMQSVYRMITKVLRNDLTVLVTGESGTGKELVAEAIHQLGSRRTGPFVAINMAAPSPERLRRRSESSNRRMAARCFSTRSATCPQRRRPGCCAPCNREVSGGSVGGTRSRSMCGSSLPPTARSRR